MNWDDPEARMRLLEQIGADEYNRQFAEWRESTVVKVVNGYSIVPANSRFGRLYLVVGTEVAFRTLPEAEAHAAQQPKRKTQ